MDREVTTTYLEMTSRSDLRPAGSSNVGLEVVRVETPSPELSRWLYTTVGSKWHWRDRLPWTDDQWQEHLSRAGVQTWVGYVKGTPAGYFELDKRGNDVELAYFGLLPAFIGAGLGGAFLTAAIERAWDMAADRVWVHTCDLDHPAALGNYEARGFRTYKTETKVETLPGRPEGPSP